MSDTSTAHKVSSPCIPSRYERQRSGGPTKKVDTIHKAAERGNTEVVLSFLKRNKALVNAQDEGGHTPLHMAALHNCYDVVDLLLRYSPDLTITDNSGWSLLHFAASGRNEKIFKLLLQQVSKAEVTARNEGGNTPLHYLAKNFAGISRATMQMLIEKGADVNAQNDNGETPLHGAALKDHYMMIERLIEFGANVEITNKLGETALNWATRKGNTNSISVLLKAHSIQDKERDKAKEAKPETPTLQSAPSREIPDDPRHATYELSFFGDNFLVTLDDDTWDQILYEGGISILNKTDNAGVYPKIAFTNPHMDAVKREELPLSKLFHLYLVISGRHKTDPEIVHWIADFLTGPKKLYLQYLAKNYSYRIRVKTRRSVPRQPSIHLDKKRQTNNGKPEANNETEFNIFQQPTQKDLELYETILGTKLPDVSSDTVRDRSLSLVEHRRVSRFRWEIDPSDVEIIGQIGAGSYGVVYKAKWMGVDVALKRIPSEGMAPEDYRSFLTEISMMSNMRHPNVLQMLGACIVPPNLFYITEYIPQGSLDKVLKQYPHLDIRVRLSMAIEITRGLYYLHSQKPPILHRDLKSLNLLVDDHFHVKLADFGLSTDKTTRLNTRVGTLNWMAPECLEGNLPYDEKADIYSLGVVLWELFAGRIPFEGKTQLQVVRLLDMREKEHIPETWDPQYVAIINECWNDNPQTRPTAKQVLQALEKVLSKYQFCDSN